MSLIVPLPDGISRNHLAAAGGPPAGTAAIFILGMLLTAALAGWLGGARSERYARSSAQADIVVSMPQIMRSGMFFETRIEVIAREPLNDATIAMSPALWRSITINTQIPEPSEQEFKSGFYQFHYGPLKAGERIAVKFDAQINPDLFLGNKGEIALLDGERPVARLPLTLTVLP